MLLLLCLAQYISAGQTISHQYIYVYFYMSHLGRFVSALASACALNISTSTLRNGKYVYLSFSAHVRIVIIIVHKHLIGIRSPRILLGIILGL